MRNPTRRNRNIGTSNQGHGSDNKLSIPTHAYESKDFYERIGKYEKIRRIINGHAFVFVVETTRKSCVHACSVMDVERIIENISATDYGDLKWIIFRQPKRKEQILSLVWGRLIYSYEFEDNYDTAIILEAVDCTKKISWNKSQTPDDQREFERLKNDGHRFVENRKNFSCDVDLEYVRNTQLYRTLLHEFGHYVHYKQIAGKIKDDESVDEWEKRINMYAQILKHEKERYAHNYADKIRQKLTKEGIIPFDRIISR